MKKTLGFILLTLAAATLANAEEFTGNVLLRDLESDVSFSSNFAFGYVVGVAEAAANLARGKAAFCSPEGVTNGQVKDIVVKWLKDNPAKRHMNAFSCVRAALLQAFPCAPPPAQPRTP